MTQFHKVTVINTDVENGLLRSLSRDLESLISNFYPSVVSLIKAEDPHNGSLISRALLAFNTI